MRDKKINWSFFSITIQPGKCRRAEFRSQNSEDRRQRTEVRGNRGEEIEKRKQDSEFRIKKLTNKKNNWPQTHTDPGYQTCNREGVEDIRKKISQKRGHID